MTRQDIEKLIGGYATGTLTPAEEQALFAAALEDQKLFEALVREQPLRDLLQDPAARASLLAALTEERVPWYRRFVWPLVATAALLCVAAPLALLQLRHPKPQPVLTAEIAEPAKPPVTQPVIPSPAPTPEARPARVRAKAAAEPTARQIRSKPELPAAPPAATPHAVERIEAAPSVGGAVAKDVIAASNQPGGGGGGSQRADVAAQAGRAVPLSSTNGFLPSQTPRPALDAATEMVAAKAALVGLKWTVLRRQPDGEFAIADPANLQAGDAVKLRLESAEAGYVYVVEGQKQLSSPINPGKPFETAIEPKGAGTRALEFWFTPRPVVSQVSDSARAVGAVHPPSTRVTLTYK